jgi:hypothetical protein
MRNAKYSYLQPFKDIFEHLSLDPILQGSICRGAVEIDSFEYTAAVHFWIRGFNGLASSSRRI